MKMDIERLLRLTADFDLFRGEKLGNMEASYDDDELSAEELDLAAAAGMPEAMFSGITEEDLFS